MFKKIGREKQRFEIHFFISFALTAAKKSEGYSVQLSRKDKATSTQTQMSQDGRVSFNEVLDIDIAMFTNEKTPPFTYQSKPFNLILRNESTNETTTFPIDIADYIAHNDQCDRTARLESGSTALVVQIRSFAETVHVDDRNYFMDGNREHTMDKLQSDLQNARERGLSVDSDFSGSRSGSFGSAATLNDRKLSALFNESLGPIGTPTMAGSSGPFTPRRRGGEDDESKSPRRTARTGNRGSIQPNTTPAMRETNRNSLLHRYSLLNVHAKQRLMSVGLGNENDWEKFINTMEPDARERLFSVAVCAPPEEVDDAMFLAAQQTVNKSRGFSQFAAGNGAPNMASAKYFYSDEEDEDSFSL